MGQIVNKFGQKTVMMSPMDFYSSITPDCSIHPGAGSGIYEEISEERLPKTRLDKSPATNSVLNAIGECGLITYNDYCFSSPSSPHPSSTSTPPSTCSM